MDLTLHSADGKRYIRWVSEDGFMVDETLHTGGIIITPEEVLPGLPVERVEDLAPSHLQGLLEFQPEMILIGCGRKQAFPPQEALLPLLRRGIGVEVMTTAAACRTFNVVTSENRIAVAALIPIS